MPESRKERRIGSEPNHISKTNQPVKSFKPIDNITTAIIWLFLAGIICILLSLSGATNNQTEITILIVGAGILIYIGVILLILAPIYRNLNSIKNYLHSIDEKLDQ